MTDYAIAVCTETNQYLLRKAESGNVTLRKQGSMAKKLDSCPFGFAQGRPFAGMTNVVSATGTN